MEKATVICVVVFLGLLQSGLIIPSLYYGFIDENSDCQQGTRGGLNLSDWLKGFGFEKIALNGVVFISTLIILQTERLEGAILLGVGMGLDFFFNIAWWIWGVVILATKENNSCVSDGKGMAVMAIIDLALAGLWYLHLKTFAGLRAQQ